MKNTLESSEHNLIKTTNLASTDWSLSNKLHKNRKNFVGTIDATPSIKDKKKTVKIICSKCGKEFKVSNNRLPSHQVKTQKNVLNPDLYTYTSCSKAYDGSSYNIEIVEDCNGVLLIPGKTFVDEFEKNGIVYKKGDEVLVTKLAWNSDRRVEKMSILSEIKTIYIEVAATYNWMYKNSYPPSQKTFIELKSGEKIEVTSSLELLK